MTRKLTIDERKEILEMELRSDRKAATEWFENAAHYMERRAEELLRYAKRFQDAFDKPDEMTQPEDILSWALNDLSSIYNNVRADMAVTNAARVAATRNALKHLNKVETGE